MENKKIITYCIPAYNSADYLDKSIQNLIECNALDAEILVVNDGSYDNTAQIAQAWVDQYPDRVHLINKENGGHGEAVMTGLAAAQGDFFFVIDGDDWLDIGANVRLLHLLRTQGSEIDLVLTNYVYEHVEKQKSKPMRYENVFPQKRIFGWEEVGKFSISQYIIMHTTVFKTQILRDSHINLPSHTFYVDNLYVYSTLPNCKKLYYLDIDLYRYYIGREGQSVNVDVMVSRIDQQLLVTRLMIKRYKLFDDITCGNLRTCLFNNLNIMMAASTITCLLSKRVDAKKLRKEIWDFLKDSDPKTYAEIRKTLMSKCVNVKGPILNKMLGIGYQVVRKVYQFN
ncbi:MAG: glycosyltransferase family 2 protein [Coriobacteriales bacterium]|nr:glycosyltransferase family 2 protein [Coriobacteriales bacterium]